MAYPPVEGFGNLVVEQRQKRRLLYPVDPRPANIAAVCLGAMSQPTTEYVPAGTGHSMGDSYPVPGYRRKGPDAFFRTICVVDEEGASINAAEIQVPKEYIVTNGSDESPSPIHLSRLEEAILEKVVHSLALLKDYAEAAGVEHNSATTFVHDSALPQ